MLSKKMIAEQLLKYAFDKFPMAAGHRMTLTFMHQLARVINT